MTWTTFLFLVANTYMAAAIAAPRTKESLPDAGFATMVAIICFVAALVLR